MRLTFLLDSKAYSYMTRAGPDAAAKKVSDASDINFIIEYLRRINTRVDPRQCRWATDYDFWQRFTGDYPSAEARLRNAGLVRDATPNESNRSTRRASDASRRSSSSRPQR